MFILIYVFQKSISIAGFTATAFAPTRNIGIEPEYVSGSSSVFAIWNDNSHEVTVEYNYENSVTLGSGNFDYLYVPINTVIYFFYDNYSFREILSTDRLDTEPPLARDRIYMKSLGRINNSGVQLYKIFNRNNASVDVSIGNVPSATNITIAKNSAVFFVEQAGGYVPFLSFDGVEFAATHPDGYYYYEEAFYLDIQSISSTPATATFEIYNRDDVEHTYVFRNAAGNEQDFTLSGYETRNITLSNEAWDVYVTVYDINEYYSSARTGITFGYSAFALNGKLKIATATPAEVTALMPGIISLTQNSPTSFTANGVISGNPAQSETVNYYFIYGTDPDNLNQSTALQQVTILAGQDANVSQEISFLTNETFYYCKLVANTTQSESKKIFLSPLPTANLKMHLRADLEITSSSNYVSTWGDVSGFDNDAIQTNGANQPMWVDNQINGNPIIRFNGTTSKMNLPTSATLGIQNNPYEMFLVTKSSLGDVQFLIAGSSLEQFEYHLNGAAGARFIPTTSVYLDKASAGNYSDGNTHVFSARASSIGGTVRVDGIDGGTSSSNILSSNSGNLLLGVRSDGSYYLNGDIAEVILYNAVLSTEDRNAVEQYLADRYNITSGELPVEMTSFTAINNGNEVVLNWQTATEVNNYGFEIERCVAQISNLCKKWEKIGFVEGHGNSNSPKDYTFTDTQTFEVFQNLKGFDGTIQYRLKQLDFDGNYEYSDEIAVELGELVKEYKLEQNYPNPFNPSTVIKYSIPVNTKSEMSEVKLMVYDILGNEVATLVNESQKSGNYEVKFDASNLASGIYLYKLQSGSFVQTRKLMLLK